MDDPPEWHGPGFGMWLMAAGALLLGGGALAGGVAAAVAGSGDAVWLVAAGLTFAPMAVWMFPPPTGRPKATTEGLVLPYSRPLRAVPYVGLAGLAVALPTVPDSPVAARAADVAVVVLGVLAAVWYRGRYALVLDPDGVRLVGRRRSWSAAWAAPVPFDDVEQNRFTVYRPHVRMGSLTIPVWMLGVGPRRAYRTLRFYAAHPGARGELADGRAVARVRADDLDPTAG